LGETGAESTCIWPCGYYYRRTSALRLRVHSSDYLTLAYRLHLLCR